MSRRSDRLLTGGYYQSDDDSDTSEVTSVSYRENPVRVFKRRHHKTTSRASSRASSVESTASNVTANEPMDDKDIGMAPPPRVTQRRLTSRAPPSKAPLPVLCPLSPDRVRASALTRSPSSAAGMDSSGYSSSELHRTIPTGPGSNRNVRPGVVLTIKVIMAVLLFLVLALLTFGLFSVMTAPDYDHKPTHPIDQSTGHTPPPRTTEGDAGVKLTLLEEKMNQVLTQLSLERDMRVRLESAASDQRVRQDQEVATLSRQVQSISTKLEAQETHTAKIELRVTRAEAVNNRLRKRLQTPETHTAKEQERPMADKMADFALETQGASVVSTRCSETYKSRSACVSLFGIPLWYPSESPRTVIQGTSMLPGKCWSFHGVQGTLLISLSHPVTITHVTLDHIPRYHSPTGRIDSAPRDFEVYGMSTDSEGGTLLGRFVYDQDGDSTQTFQLPEPTRAVYHFVELRVLSNWGHLEYTCLYRFRVHGLMGSA